MCNCRVNVLAPGTDVINVVVGSAVVTASTVVVISVVVVGCAVVCSVVVAMTVVVSSSVLVITTGCANKKTIPLIFDHTFGQCGPIFILSPINS